MTKSATWQELSTATGKSQKTLKELWAARPEAPARTRPWPELCKFARETTIDANTTATAGEPKTLSEAEFILKKKRGLKIDQDLEKGSLEIAKLRGKMVPMEELERDVEAIADLYEAMEIGDSREHPSLYSDKTFVEIEAIAKPRVGEKIAAFKAALLKVGKESAAELARQAKIEKYGTV